MRRPLLSAALGRIPFLVLLFSLLALTALYAQPANDNCSGAIPITAGSPLMGSTTTATVEAPLPATCGTAITAPGVWYTYTPSMSGLASFSTCNMANYDTKISVYSGTCGTLTCLGGNDDGASCSGATSLFTANVVGGTTYYIVVNGFNGLTGNFTLSVTFTPPPLPQPTTIARMPLR
ncbi:MAG: hypothetical protein HC821_01835 [Lewinella sp.]|nr:hypothetical protein [Lewinella sp.]